MSTAIREAVAVIAASYQREADGGKPSKDEQREVTRVAVFLAVTVLTDLNRIADALEKIAAAQVAIAAETSVGE